jgi:hypothetical protein
MRTATIERFWNSQQDRLAKETPRCVVTLTERNKVKIWELDLKNPAHSEIEGDLAYRKTYTCCWSAGEEPCHDGRPFEITYQTTTKSSIDLLLKVGEPISIRTVPREAGSEELRRQMLTIVRTEVFRSLSRKPMRLDEVEFDIWIRLEESPNPNPFAAPEGLRIKATLNQLLKDGSVIKPERGVYALSNDSRYEWFREAVIALCANEPDDSAFVTAPGG